MADSEILVEVWRGGRVECVHRGHAVVVDEKGEIVASWGDPAAMIYPRSSSKMLQALPLMESGAADQAGLTTEQLALSCASHQGAAIHTDRVAEWLGQLGMTDSDLRCGPQMPSDPPAYKSLLCSDHAPWQLHNNCSGKHCGFLTLNRHLGGGAEYIDVDHPVQKAVKAAFEEMTGETSPGYGIDGCSAPNYACTVHGLGRAMARMAVPDGLGRAREDAAKRLVSAMMAHPLLIAGEGRACSSLVTAMEGRAAVKTGAEGVFVGIAPGKRLGFALKIEDGATRASEAAMAALLVRMGLLEAGHPAAERLMNAPITNRRDILTGHVKAAETLLV